MSRITVEEAKACEDILADARKRLASLAKHASISVLEQQVLVVARAEGARAAARLASAGELRHADPHRQACPDVSSAACRRAWVEGFHATATRLLGA